LIYLDDFFCLVLGIEGFTTREDQEEISRIEKQIRRRFVVGSQVSEHAIVQDFIRQVRNKYNKINKLFFLKFFRIIQNVVFIKFFMQWYVVVMFNIVCNVKFLFVSDKSNQIELSMTLYRYRDIFFCQINVFFFEPDDQIKCYFFSLSLSCYLCNCSMNFRKDIFVYIQ